jgi:hypothetical protein
MASACSTQRNHYRHLRKEDKNYRDSSVGYAVNKAAAASKESDCDGIAHEPVD